MPNPFFKFKQFTIFHDRCAMKVTTDGCLFGAWCARQLHGLENKKALDIGAGTGLLSLMVAQQTSVAVDAVELDPEAAAQAAQNVAASPWQQRIHVFASDIKDFTPTVPYAVIFSNPPFYEQELESEIAGRNLAHHGHGLKLFELLEACNRMLAHNGDLFLLLPAKRKQEILRSLTDAGFFIAQKITVHPSSVHPPFRLMLQVRKQKPEKLIEETLFIKDDQQQYTAAFTSILQPYYLYL